MSAAHVEESKSVSFAALPDSELSSSALSSSQLSKSALKRHKKKAKQLAAMGIASDAGS